jgi:hypothetical protein
VLWPETELDGVEQLVPGGRGEDGPSPRAGKVEGAVEVYDLESWGLFSGEGRLHLWRLVGEWISPFGGEFSQSFAFDHLGGFEGDLEGLKLHVPLCHPSGDISVA